MTYGCPARSAEETGSPAPSSNMNLGAFCPTAGTPTRASSLAAAGAHFVAAGRIAALAPGAGFVVARSLALVFFEAVLTRTPLVTLERLESCFVTFRREAPAGADRAARFLLPEPSVALLRFLAAMLAHYSGNRALTTASAAWRWSLWMNAPHRQQDPRARE